MSRILAKNTKPELLVRKALHRLGFRFRLHRRDLPGTPDIVLPRHRAAILVHGCFWHKHDDPSCPLARLPKTRLDFWLPKLEGNRRRDASKVEQLLISGWRTMIVWECELRHMEQVENRILYFLRGGGNDARD